MRVEVTLLQVTMHGHRVGFTPFNEAPLIKLKKAPRQIAQRILSELEVGMLIRAAGAAATA